MNLYYFAYGSNLHPLRLSRRIASAKLISTSSIEGYDLKFNKKGQDNSSKCNLNFTGNNFDCVHGAVYEIDQEDLRKLDKIEGLNQGYLHQQLSLIIDQKPITALAYIAMPAYLDGQDKPFTWYKEIVIAGMQYLKFNPNYIQLIKSVQGKKDTNQQRENRMRNHLSEMNAISMY